MAPCKDTKIWKVRISNERTVRFRLAKFSNKIQSIRGRQLSCRGDRHRMKNTRCVEKILIKTPGRPKNRQIGSVESHLQEMEVKNWRSKVKNKKVWTGILEEAKKVAKPMRCTRQLYWLLSAGVGAESATSPRKTPGFVARNEG